MAMDLPKHHNLDTKEHLINFLNMEKEFNILRMEIYIKDHMSMENHKEKDIIHGLINHLSKDSLKMGREMETESGKVL